MILLRYFRLTMSIGIGRPKPFSILLMALMPAVLAPLLSMAILRGSLFTLGARAKKTRGSGLVPALGQHKIQGLGVFVDKSVKVKPVALHFHICFTHAPRTVCGPLSIPRCFRNEACIPTDPAVQRCVIQIDATFRHDFFQIPVGNTVPQV